MTNFGPWLVVGATFQKAQNLLRSTAIIHASVKYFHIDHAITAFSLRKRSVLYSSIEPLFQASDSSLCLSLKGKPQQPSLVKASYSIGMNLNLREQADALPKGGLPSESTKCAYPCLERHDQAICFLFGTAETAKVKSVME